MTQRVFPVRYEWPRLAALLGLAVGLWLLGSRRFLEDARVDVREAVRGGYRGIGVDSQLTAGRLGERALEPGVAVEAAAAADIQDTGA
jgi:hypothetical protein